MEHFGELTVDSSSDLQVFKVEEDLYKVIKDGKNFTLRIIDFDQVKNTFEIAVDGIKITGKGESELDAMIAQLGFNENSELSVKEILAPMPGLVLSLEALEGETVEKDQALLILEAMKMENILKSPSDGVIKSIKAEEGKNVEKNQVLVV